MHTSLSVVPHYTDEHGVPTQSSRTLAIARLTSGPLAHRVCEGTSRLKPRLQGGEAQSKMRNRSKGRLNNAEAPKNALQ